MPSLTTTESGGCLRTYSVEYIRDYGSSGSRNSGALQGASLKEDGFFVNFCSLKEFKLHEEKLSVWSSDSVVVRMIYEQARLEARVDRTLFSWKLTDLSSPRCFGKDPFGFFYIAVSRSQKAQSRGDGYTIQVALGEEVKDYLKDVELRSPPEFYILINFAISGVVS